MHKRLLIVFLFGFSSGLPLALLTSTLQAWFASTGSSIMATGFLSLVGLPYLYRFIFGPLVDNLSLLSLGKRRSWILITQLLLLIGFNAAAMLSPRIAPQSMMVLAFILASVSAIQDLVIDAHRVEYLPKPEHGLGASIAVLGFRLALLSSGGLALVLADHLGFAFTYRLMGLLMLLGIFATLISPEPSLPFKHKLSSFASFKKPIKELFARNRSIYLILFILFYKLGEAFTASTSGIVTPFLITGLGFPLDTIGYVNKFIGVGSIILGGLTAGLLLIHWSLFRALLIFGLLQAASNSLFVALAIIGKDLPLFATAVILDNFATGMGSTALLALFMRLTIQPFTATQFSLLVAISTIPRVFSGPIAAYLQQLLGWVGLYQLSFILAFGFIPFLLICRNQISAPEEMNFEPFTRDFTTLSDEPEQQPEAKQIPAP